MSMSSLVLVLCVGAVAAEVEGLMMLEHVLFESMGTGGVYLTSVIIAVLIPFIQTLFSRLAVGLTDNVRNRSSLSFQTEALLY